MQMSERKSNGPSSPVRQSLPLNEYTQINGRKREDDDQQHTRSSSNPGV